MVLHVVDALAELPLERIVVVVGPRRRAGHEDAAGAARHRGAGRVRRAARAARHRRRGERRAHRRSRRPRRRGRHPRAARRRTRCCAPRRSPRSRPSTALPGRRRDRSSPPTLADPTGYGRVVRDKDGRVARIVEHADANADEREINEINTSIYCFRRSLLAPALRRLSPENAQGEYYLTDAIEVLRDAGPQGASRVAGRRPGRGAWASTTARSSPTPKPSCARRINRRVDARRRHDGRSRRAPTSTRRSSSSPTCACCRARSSRAAPSIGAGSVIGPDCHLVDVVVGERVAHRRTPSPARPRSATTARSVRSRYLRPGTRARPRARRSARSSRSKNSDIGEGTKVPAPLLRRRRRRSAPAPTSARARSPPTTTASNKHRTKIGDGVHTGVHTSLVAPVELGDGADTGAGSVVTHDVPPGALAKGVPARSHEGWVAERRTRMRTSSRRDRRSSEGRV